MKNLFLVIVFFLFSLAAYAIHPVDSTWQFDLRFQISLIVFPRQQTGKIGTVHQYRPQVPSRSSSSSTDEGVSSKAVMVCSASDFNDTMQNLKAGRNVNRTKFSGKVVFIPVPTEERIPCVIIKQAD